MVSENKLLCEPFVNMSRSYRRRRSTSSRKTRRSRQSHSRRILQQYHTKHLPSGAVDWRDVNANLPYMSDRQKQEMLRVAIIYKNTTMIRKLLRQGIRPMKSYYKFVEDARIRKLLPRASRGSKV